MNAREQAEALLAREETNAFTTAGQTFSAQGNGYAILALADAIQSTGLAIAAALRVDAVDPSLAIPPATVLSSVPNVATERLCPECKQGKTINCTGEFLDSNDALTTCATQLQDDGA